jgi:plastocyanin
MKVVAFLAALVIAYVVVVIASGAGIGVSGGDGRSAEIVLEDLRFAPNRLDAKVGVPLTVRLTNAGTERHDLNFESLHMPGLAGVESILEPGETRTITLRFDTPGVHTFICTLPGHAATGMTGAAFVRS